ncbi:MAG: GTP-binding protein [Promethearchaeota archaeon]|nr:MAG: GTP-binding protein [Candidatus Lokiarchaeota archaeon]
MIKKEFSIKVIIIGNYRSGKSSIVRRLVKNEFSEKHEPTIGLDISKKTLKIDDVHLRFSFWDSGGLVSQISNTKKMLYNQANAVLLVIDSSKKSGLKTIKKWLEDIKSSVSKSIPILIIGNKNDLLISEGINEKDIKNLKSQCDFTYISTSAKNGDNVGKILMELRNLLEYMTKNVEILDEGRKYEKYYLIPIEQKALMDLEYFILDRSLTHAKKQIDLIKLKKKGFPHLLSIDETSFGFRMKNGSITEISLFNCGIKKLPDSFKNFKYLKKLFLRCNPLEDVPEIIFKIKSLEQLDLSLTNLKEIPDSIRNLKSLKKLKLENNHLTKLPDSIGNLQNLKTLNLENNPMNSLPSSFCHLTKLTELFLETSPFDPSGYMIKLPKDFGDLINLEKLDLSSHKLKALPQSFRNLKRLKNLDLFNNRFRALPHFIGDLHSLEELNLEKNLIEFIPNTLGDLTNLKQINLKNNIITPKKASDKFKAYAFKAIGKDYKRWMRIADSIAKKEDHMQVIRKELKQKTEKAHFFLPLMYASIIAIVGLLTFMMFDISSQITGFPIIWLFFFGALIINLLIGSSIISTISSYFKITVSRFGTLVQTRILKGFDILVVLLLIWAVRAAVITALRIELIPAVNFLFEYTIPKWFLGFLILIGYDIDLSFLENIDLFLGHFYIKIFSNALVFWALYRYGFNYMRKTAFDEMESKNIWPFLIIGLFGTFILAILNYSSLKPLLSIGYCVGVIIGACLFLYEKNKENLSIFYTYMCMIGIGILLVWLVSSLSLLISLVIGIIFVFLFLVVRRHSHVLSY